MVHQEDSRAACDSSDLRDRNTSDLMGNALASGGREQQFVVVTAMKRQPKVNFAGWSPHNGARNGGCLHFRPDAALFADVGQISGEAIAQVDRGRGQPTFHQNAANFKAGAGREMSLELIRPDLSPREKQIQGCRSGSK